jgi:beta-barrel assembly-enhancing protease
MVSVLQGAGQSLGPTRISRMVRAAIFAAAAGMATFPITSHTEGLPDLGDSSDAVVSEPQERAIGKRIMLEVRGDRAFVDDPELSDYITSLGNRMVAASHGATNDNRRDFEFFLLNDESINAFALLGGFIGVHSGLVLTSTTESELAGVVGHEIAHILQRHQSRGADEQRKAAPLQLLTLAAAIVAARSNSSSSGQATEALLTTSAALQYQNQLNYSRDFEREADRLGIQIMARAGFDPQGMPGFFERMLRANRHNDGKAPGYLRSHPLTTERIADMQDRAAQMGGSGKRSVPDSIEYRFAKAKLRVSTSSPNEAAAFFRNSLAESTLVRNRADTYGLALALTQAHDYATAEKVLAGIRPLDGAAKPGVLSTVVPHPWVENLAAQIKLGQKKWNDALAIYKDGMKNFPQERSMFYGYIDTLYESGQIDAALAAANEKLRTVQDDPRYYELAAKCYERKNKRLAQHRAIGEAYYRRGNLIGAIEQYQIAAKAKDGDFYESSGVESRLRELKVQYKNRALMPGEKRDTPMDRDDDREDRSPPTTKPASKR